jgi:hypothetical protein
MMTMTNPRKASTDSSRGRTGPESAGLKISEARLPVWGVDAMTSHYHNGPVPSDDFRLGPVGSERVTISAEAAVTNPQVGAWKASFGFFACIRTMNL